MIKKQQILSCLLMISMALLTVQCGPEKGQKQGSGDEAAKGGDSEIDQKVEALLGKMSLDEKVGQMTQLNLNMLLDGGYGNNEGTLSEDSLEKALVKYKIGSVINAVNHGYSPDRWHKIIKGIQDVATQKTPNNIPVLYGIDAIHGANYTLKSALFPHNIGMAAARNTGLIKKSARITAKQVRASGIRWNFDPVLDIGRNPLWSRFPETFGEDVELVKQMGVAAVKGYEAHPLDSVNAVASTMKHFVGYSNPATGKDRTPAYIPEIMLREYYLPQFKAAVEAGASTIMINSGEVNGVPVHASKKLLTDILRDEFGFEGLVVTDWEDVIRLHTRHKVAKNGREAVKMAVKAGIDMSMVPHDYSFCKHLKDLVKSGDISEERIDESVRRILKLKFKTGLFENAYPEEAAKQFFNKPAYDSTALKAARETITLLKNDTLANGNAVLPLRKDQKVLLAGPGANGVSHLHGSWSFTWQGKDESWYPESIQSIAEALQAETDSGNLINIAGDDWNDAVNFDTQKLKARASAADAIVLCLGEEAYAESPGVINDLMLPERQMQLGRAAVETGKPVIILLTEGRPRVFTEIAEKADGIVQAYQPGSQGAPAIADVLYGDHNPAGKLPYTYHQYTGDLVLYDHKFSSKVEELEVGQITHGGYKPLYPFGHGLSYTHFTYDGLNLSAEKMKGKQPLTISVEVTNEGDRAGQETVELYTRDLYASVTPPQKRLRKFKKISLKPGETKTVSFELNKEDLAFVNRDMKWVTETGRFEVMIGGENALFTYTNQ